MKAFLPALSGALLLLLPSASGQEQQPAPDPAARYAEAAGSVDADLRAELAKLAALRERIAAERPPLALEAERVATELRTKRRQAELAGQKTEALRAELEKREREVRVWRDEHTYIRSLLDDYRGQAAKQLSLAELERLTAPADSRGMKALLDLLEQGAGRMEAARGGRVLEGKVVAPDGIARNGTFVQVGPVEWFLSQDEQLAGLAVGRPGLQAEVAPRTGDAGVLSALAEGKAARPAFDPTLGTALALQAANPGLIEHLYAGGLWMIPILLLGLIATLAGCAKWIQILGIREIKPALIREVLASLHSGNPDEARRKLEGVRHPARALLARGVEVSGQPHELVEEAIYEQYVAAQPSLQRGLPFIAIAAGAAPLFGLLGTVTGMIHTFQLIQIFGSGNARSLASGISEALITTEYGLIVAIPALILHAFLSRKVKGILGTMEMASLAFLNGLKSKPAS